MATPNPTPVLLLSVDTLRRDRFTGTCFPESMTIFEKDFAHFTNAHSHGNATPFAFPGIITSHTAINDGQFPDTAVTIAELFDEATSAFTNNGHLRAERGYDRGFDIFHDQHPPDHSPSTSTFQRLKSIRWLRESDLVVKCYRTVKKLTDNGSEGSESLDKPTWSAERVTDFVRRRLAADDQFVWAHYMDPHKPFIPETAIDGPEIDRSDEEIAWLNDYERSTDPPDAEGLTFLEELYDANIRYMDRELARLLRELRERPWYDDALIVFVGDHGELFGEHGRMFHPWDMDPPDLLIQTPLLIKYPGGAHAGETFDHLVQHGDILPTIAQAIGTEIPDLPPGIQPLSNTGERHILSKANTAIRLTESNATAVRRRDGTDDGFERISATGREILEAASFPTVTTVGGKAAGLEDVQRQEQLKALGYR